MLAEIVINKRNGERLFTGSVNIDGNGNSLKLRDPENRFIHADFFSCNCGRLHITLTVRNRTTVLKNPLLNSFTLASINGGC